MPAGFLGMGAAGWGAALGAAGLAANIGGKIAGAGKGGGVVVAYLLRFHLFHRLEKARTLVLSRGMSLREFRLLSQDKGN